MNYTLKKSRAIKYVAVVIALVISLFIWPTTIIRNTYSVGKDEAKTTTTDTITNSCLIEQVFKYDGTYLDSIDLYMEDAIKGQVFAVNIFDENNNSVFFRIIQVAKQQVGEGWLKVDFRTDELETGKNYRIIIQGLTEDLVLGMTDNDPAQSGVPNMTYAGTECPGHKLMVVFNYRDLFPVWEIVVFYLIIWGLVAVVFILTNKKLVGTDKDKELTVQRVLKFTVNPLLAGILIWATYYLAIYRIFGFDTKNNLFMTGSVWMFCALIAFVVNAKYKTEIKTLPELKASLPFIKENISNWLQIIAIAMMLWYCYEYMNSLYDIEHTYSMRRVLIAFFAVLITNYKKDEILRIPNLIWLIAGPIIGYLYAKPYFDVPEQNIVYQLEGGIIAVGGFVVINLVYSIINLIRKKNTLAKINWFFFVPVLIFFGGMCVLNNTRTWPAFMTVICGLICFRLLYTGKAAIFTENICKGIILNFYMMIIFSLCYRPYYYYIFYRYSMGFHTVTVTAYYIAMVFAAALVRAYIVFREKKSLLLVFPQLVTLGLAGGYLLMTLSRTGIFSALGIVVIALISIAITDYKGMDKIKYGLGMLLIILGLTLYAFPITFTATRIFPSLVNDPIIFDYEITESTMYRGTPRNTPNLITIERYVEAGLDKMFGISRDITGRGNMAVPVPPEEEETVETTVDSTVESSGEAGGETTEATKEETKKDRVTMPEPAMGESDFSNGRFSIFVTYINEWNLWGHDSMVVVDDAGVELAHAHNAFIQVAYDFGMVFGAYFILFALYNYVLAYIQYKNKQGYSLLLFVLMTGFAVAGMVEWIFHPCNPFTASAFMAMMPLIVKEKKDEKSN